MTEEKLEQIKKNIAFNLGMAGAVNRISNDIVQEILREETELYEACKGLLSYQKNAEKVFEADKKKIEELELSLSGSTFCYDEEEHKELQQENKQLKEEIKKYQKELEKADSITQSCIFQGKEESGISFRNCLNMITEYKTRIAKAIEYIENNTELDYLEYRSCYKEIVESKKILEILKGDSNGN